MWLQYYNQTPGTNSTTLPLHSLLVGCEAIGGAFVRPSFDPCFSKYASLVNISLAQCLGAVTCLADGWED